MSKYSGFLSKVAKSGFYIILFLCISAIGISGYVMYVARDAAKDVKEGIESQGVVEIPFPDYDESDFDTGKVLSDIEDKTDNDTRETMSEQIKPKEEAEKEPASKKETPQPVEKKQEAVYTVALGGAITTPFSGEELIKSKTMDDWRIHQGVDIKGELGAEVRAICDGEVSEVKKDEMLGCVVKLTHNDGICSIYANLSEDIPVAKGDVIKGGDVVGKVGNSAISECLDEPHLHLEVTENGKHIDPLSLFPAGED